MTLDANLDAEESASIQIGLLFTLIEKHPIQLVEIEIRSQSA